MKSLPSFGVRLLFGLLVLRFRSVLLFFPDKGGNLCGDVLQNRDVLTVLGVVLPKNLKKITRQVPEGDPCGTPLALTLQRKMDVGLI